RRGRDPQGIAPFWSLAVVSKPNAMRTTSERRSPPCRFWRGAVNRTPRFSFDHLVGDSEQRRRDGQIEHRGSLIVDDQLELVRLHDRKVRRLGSLENAAGISASLAPRRGPHRA